MGDSKYVITFRAAYKAEAKERVSVGYSGTEQTLVDKLTEQGLSPDKIVVEPFVQLEIGTDDIRFK